MVREGTDLSFDFVVVVENLPAVETEGQLLEEDKDSNSAVVVATHYYYDDHDSNYSVAAVYDYYDDHIRYPVHC